MRLTNYENRREDEGFRLVKGHLDKDPTLGRRKLQRLTGLTKCQVQTRLAWYRREVSSPLNDPTIDPSLGQRHMEVDGDSAVLTYTTKSPVKTEEDAIREGGVDLNRWDVKKCKMSFWTMGFKDQETQEPGRMQLYSVRLDLERKVVNTEAFIQAVQERIAEHSPVVRPIHILPQNRGRLLELDFMDLHVGKYSWPQETNHSWDVKLAIEVCDRALDELLRLSGLDFEMVLMPIGNDLLHVNNLIGTTAGGTQQDCDGRITKMLESTLEMLVRQIDHLKTLAPVHILIVAGNHDTLTTMHLGTALKAWYHNDSNVHIDNRPLSRKYYEYGKCLIGFCHGCKDDPPLKDLPMMMAVEQPEAWARAIHKHWHVGHLHKSQSLNFWGEDMFNSIIVRRIRSLTPPDLWHYQKGYLNPHARGAESFLWDADRGLKQHNLVYVKEQYG